MFLKGYTDFTFYIINIDRYRATESSSSFASYSWFNIDSYTSILCVNREKTMRSGKKERDDIFRATINCNEADDKLVFHRKNRNVLDISLVGIDPACCLLFLLLHFIVLPFLFSFSFSFPLPLFWSLFRFRTRATPYSSGICLPLRTRMWESESNYSWIGKKNDFSLL